jgi:hypothetical protein
MSTLLILRTAALRAETDSIPVNNEPNADDRMPACALVNVSHGSIVGYGETEHEAIEAACITLSNWDDDAGEWVKMTPALILDLIGADALQWVNRPQ